MDLGVSGLASGFDWRSLVDQLVDVERTPQKRLLNDQNLVQQRNNAYGSLKTQLVILQGRVKALADASLFDSRTAHSSDSSVATVQAGAGAQVGNFKVDVLQMATAAKRIGLTDVGGKLAATNDVSGVVLGSAGFSTAVTAGKFSVNGSDVTIATSDSLQGVFDKISAATGGVVTGSYDSNTDQISLQSSNGEIVLGSANDTSNFLAVTKLQNNGTGSVTSSGMLGGLKKTSLLQNANFSTPISDGGSGAGKFKINGVEISFNASTESLNDVLNKINNSEAGVTAAYDASSDRISITNTKTGDVGISFEDVTGNFISAAGLGAAVLQRGQNLTYKINDGDVLTSSTNVISEESSGLTGINITALKEGTVTVSVRSDTEKIKTAIKEFVTEYNKVQSVINTQTASSTDSKGKVTAGLLANESFSTEIGSALRSNSFSKISSLPESLNHLADIGIQSSGTSDDLTLEDEAALDAILNNNISGLKTLFTDATDGIGTKLNGFLEKVVGEEGTLIAKQDSLTKQSSDIDTQIADLERIVEANRLRLVDSFVAMETAQAKINQQMQFLQQRFGGGSQAAGK